MGGPVSVLVNQSISLPSNPNGIVFISDAAELLAGRPWVDVQRIAAKALRSFYASSSLDIAAYFCWRVGLDSSDQRRSQVTLHFVIDGPAAPHHLNTLEEALSDTAVPWSAPTIESVPDHALRSLYMKGGDMHQVWTRVEGVAYHYWLDLEGVARVRVGKLAASRARPDVFLPGLVHVIGRPGREADDDLERMRLAFARVFVQRIVEADGVVDSDEKSFLYDMFPADLMHARRLAQPELLKKWYTAACDQLHSRLGHHDKLALIGLLFSASYSDGSLDKREMMVLRQAGKILGLENEQVINYLRAFL